MTDPSSSTIAPIQVVMAISRLVADSRNIPWSAASSTFWVPGSVARLATARPTTPSPSAQVFLQTRNLHHPPLNSGVPSLPKIRLPSAGRCRPGIWDAIIGQLTSLWHIPVHQTQGNRVLTEQDFEEVIVPPASLQALALDAHFQAGFPFQLVVGYLPQRRHVPGAVVFARPALVFPEGDIQAPVQ